jgi:hypothetical protein
MITVADVYADIQRVLGTCDEAETYNKINESIEELANLGNWDPMVLYLDICTHRNEITLPDDIEVPLAINVGGSPADFRNKWFEFHLNGPGSECCGSSCTFAWTDKGNFPTFRDPIEPSQVAAYPEGTEADGTNIRVYGYDECEKWIMTPDCNGVLQDGFDVPVLNGMGFGMTTSQKVKRITRVSKPVTNSFIKLVALDPGSSQGGTLLGLFRPNITEPEFRRITVSGGGTAILNNCNCTTWVRMRARRKTFKVSQLSDPIPLHSVTALKMMAQAIKKYEADLLAEYAGYFAAARDALQREQKSRSGPNQIKIQFQGNFAAGRCGGGNMI